MILNLDPIAQIIPLCIDYILENQMAEEKSLAFILDLNGNNVRKALSLLRSHGILSSEDFAQEYFRKKFADKLGLTNYDFGSNIDTTLPS